MNSSIGILGCGWLGLPLAIELIEQGHKVRGTTTALSKVQVLEEQGIEPFLIKLHPESIEGPIVEFLQDLDILIINVPPALRKHPQESYLGKIRTLHKHIKKSTVGKVLFVSSTSVYGKAEGEITEEVPIQPVTESAKQLAAAEQLLFDDQDIQTCALRFGGLIGPGRHPVIHLTGRSDLGNGDEAVNLIHLNDCIHMITSIINHGWWNEVFNGVYPDHPRKAEYYRKEALKHGLQPPSYKSATGVKKGKIINSKNFLNKKELFYTSIHS